MAENIINNKRIAKNTIVLYIRMILIMVTTLFTSRVVLKALGVEDYGIYNVVGGVVTMLGFLNGTLSTASSRYITVSLGRDDSIRQNQVFASVLQVNILLAAIVFIFSESLGLWFLNTQMSIAADRMYAANWVYQISIFTIIVNMISVPYNAAIIAHEKMKAFAYISLFDCFAKLGIAYLVMIDLSIDRLILYAIMLGLVQLIDRLIYGQYCSRHFGETRYKPYFSKELTKNMFSFISWSAYGSFASVLFSHGLNILLNIFFGPVVNAARAVAVQVQHAVTAFNQNFHMAFNPQLIKTVAVGDFKNAGKLMLASSRFSFYLLCFLGLPIISEAPYILKLWLENVPDHAVVFVQIMLTISIWQSLANSLRVVNQAEGNIKKFQLSECTYLLLILPISYIALKAGLPPESVFCIHLFIELTANIIRISIVLPKISMSKLEYIRNIYLRIMPIYLLPLIFSYLLQSCFEQSFGRFIFNSIIIELVLITLIIMIGLEKEEIHFVSKKISSIIKKNN